MFLCFLLSTISRYDDLSKTGLSSLYRIIELHDVTLTSQLVIYWSRNLFLNNGIKWSLLTDSGNSHTSVKPVWLRMSRIFDDQLLALFLRSISNLCKTTTCLRIQFPCFTVCNFKKYFTILTYLSICKGHRITSAYSYSKFVTFLRSKVFYKIYGERVQYFPLWWIP